MRISEILDKHINRVYIDLDTQSDDNLHGQVQRGRCEQDLMALFTAFDTSAVGNVTIYWHEMLGNARQRSEYKEA